MQNSLISVIREGEISPNGKGVLFARGIEIGHIFKLGFYATPHGSRCGRKQSRARVQSSWVATESVSGRLLSAVMEQRKLASLCQ